MPRETKDAREEREDAEDAAALAKADKDAAKVAKPGREDHENRGATVRAELQNLRDRVAANQADEIAKSFAKLDTLVADA